MSPPDAFCCQNMKMIVPTRTQQLGLIILLGALVLYVIWRTQAP